jgi:carbamoyltransferase
MKDWMRSKLWLRNELSRRLEISPSRVEFCSHHLSHAYQAFVGSPFDEAAVLTVDAVGEWASTGLFRARKGVALDIRPMETIPYPHSLGLLYSVFTAYLGFRPNDGESSVMALASFGQPRYRDEVGKVLRVHADGTYEIDQSYLDHFSPIPYTAQFVALFGEPRNFKEALPFSALGEGASRITPDHQRHADIAASLQRERSIASSAANIFVWPAASRSIAWPTARCCANRLSRISMFRLTRGMEVPQSAPRPTARSARRPSRHST